MVVGVANVSVLSRVSGMRPERRREIVARASWEIAAERAR
jgi:hypothetical protein